MKHFERPKAGEWINPRRRGYWLKCCDCGLVHFLRFRLAPNEYGHGRKIQFQAFRVRRGKVLQWTGKGMPKRGE